MDRTTELLYTVSKSYKNKVPHTVNKLRVEAIARKALREGRHHQLIIRRLMRDYYFKEIQQKIGKNKAYQLAKHVIKKALRREKIAIHK